MGIALNLGCGKDIRKNVAGHTCINVDIRQLEGVDEIWDVTSLQIEDEMIDYILASDIIEHFPKSETLSILKEWARVLKPGGILEIRTPDLEYLATEFVEKRYSAEFFSYYVFGGQDYEQNFHYAAFDMDSLYSLCVIAGFKELQRHQEQTNFRLKVKKRENK